MKKRSPYYFNNPERNKQRDQLKNRFNAAKSMSEKIKKEKKKGEVVESTSEDEDSFLEESVTPTDLGKTTKLVFFKKYYTYQALLEVMPKPGLSVNKCRSKVILYIMRWFRNRLGDEVFDKYEDIAYLRSDYPMPEDYGCFEIENVHNIEGLSFLDLETIYIPKKKAWLFSLTEPDNGQENKDIQGRTFKTEISVYLKSKSVVLGIRESCREHETNTEDAFGLRPGFVRDLFYDEQLIIGEQGLKAEYAFGTKPISVNGKSKMECENLYNDLIVSKNRQMPVLFVPGDYYKEHRKEVNEKTASLLGFCHVVVLRQSFWKLFGALMCNEELAKEAEEEKLIFYRSTKKQAYMTDYFDGKQDDILSQIKSVAQHEPIRKRCDFGRFSFEVTVADLAGGGTNDDLEAAATEIKRLRSENKELTQRLGDYERDNESLQKQNELLSDQNRKYWKDSKKNDSDNEKMIEEIRSINKDLETCKNKNRELIKQSKEKDRIINSQYAEEKKRIIPLLSIPSKKDGVLPWIKEFYEKELIIHPSAVKSFNDDSRNIDIHKFCMMIHYLAGYTKYRNSGGKTIDHEAAREYDPEDSSFKVEPSGSGLGATEMYRNKYTITLVDANGGKKDVLLDLHIKTGKGADANMIRIYFCYSPELKKSVIGYMPGHLPTRQQPH